MKVLKQLLLVLALMPVMISSSYSGSSIVHPFSSGRLLDGDRCHFGTTNCVGNGYHLGVDLMGAAESGVLSMCDGIVKHNNTASATTWDSKVIIEHDCNGKKVFGIYGHISSSLIEDTPVDAGQEIGTIKAWTGNSHLHMGISTIYIESYWGYGSKKRLSNFMDFNDLLTGLNTVPYFDGTGSLIDPQNDCYGCSKDSVMLHSHGQQPSAGFFQVFRIPGVCEAVELEGLTYADVEVRSWNGYGTESEYYTLNSLPAVVPLKNTSWNLIAFKTVSPIPLEQTRTVTASCVAQIYNDPNVSKKSSGTPMRFDEDYFWGGNGSLIRGSNNQYSNDTQAGYGRDRDSVVLLRNEKTLSVFQATNTDSCGSVRFTTPTPFSLSWKLWDEKNWRGTIIINNGNKFTFPDGYWWILKVKAPATGANNTQVYAVCEP